MVALAGAAMDAEDGALAGAGLAWSVDGQPAGSGSAVTVAGLAPGAHQARLTATDSAGQARGASVGFTIEPLSVPSAASPTLDGACDDGAYATAAAVELRPYAAGGQAHAQLLRNADQLWVCLSGLSRATGQSAGAVTLRVDADHSRGSALASGDVELSLGEEGLLTTRHGAGPAWGAATAGGLAGQVSADAQSWSAELRIDAATIGGWDRLVGLALTHAPGDGAAYAWPYAAAETRPSSWAAALLGALPRLAQLSPAAVPAGSPAFTLTVAGSGFAPGAVVRWEGAALPTTFISGAELRAAVGAERLTVAATARITVVNPGGLAAAPSNALPVTVGDGGQAGGAPLTIYLPLVRR